LYSTFKRGGKLKLFIFSEDENEVRNRNVYYSGTTLYKTCADATFLRTRMLVGVGITSAEAAL
jgi:hypothetical protein